MDLRKPDVGPKEIRALVGTFQVKVAAEAFFREQPDVARRYVLANQDTVRWIQDAANFEQLVRYMRDRVKLAREVPQSERLFGDLIKQYAGFSSAAVSRRSVAAWNEFELAAGTIKSPVKFDDAVWTGAPATD